MYTHWALHTTGGFGPPYFLVTAFSCSSKTSWQMMRQTSALWILLASSVPIFHHETMWLLRLMFKCTVTFEFSFWSISGGSWIGRLRKTWICISELNYLSTELSDCLQSASHEKMSTFTELDSVWTQNVLKHCISIISCDPSSSVLGVVNIWKCIWPSFF